MACYHLVASLLSGNATLSFFCYWIPLDIHHYRIRLDLDNHRHQMWEPFALEYLEQ
jgi:hypothetical protein